MFFQKFRGANTLEFSDMAAFERQHAAIMKKPPHAEAATFYLSGFCGVCRRRSKFAVDYLYGGDIETRQPNYRERLVCTGCGLNSRLRASVSVLAESLSAKSDIYLTESVTPLFAALRRKFSRLTGSEFLRDGTPQGQVNAKGIRHEDLTALSFPEATFDAVASFECLEHIPDYKAALRECRRVLRKGGRLFLTAPFLVNQKTTTIRAFVDDLGDIQHLLEPEYHGDPVSEGGVLCFYHFGWSLLDDLIDAGFKHTSVLVLSDQYGGHVQPQFIFRAEA
ncbi:MAG: class I SAM-dependent methyltransferase [Proteobacteria bacterium]|nr:class I SAM-dependent methyltransferase [Pseudomonadota bacterium]